MKTIMRQRSDIHILALAALFYLAVQISAKQIHHNNNNRNNVTTNNNATELRETLLPTGKCKEIASCKLRSRRRDLDVGGTGADKTNCFCDQQCKLYDDCCIDSPWTESLAERVKLGVDKLRKRRSQWHCKRINNIFGDIVLRASCMPEWIQKQDDPELANQTVKRCEYVKDRGKSQADENDRAAELDPVGMMMPITDLVSGITYANSYCLRCNTPAVGSDWAEILRRQKFIYWSPLLECNYNTDSDDRNTLYDLISMKKGQVLKYSNKKNKWTIKLPASAKSNTNRTMPDDQRVCSIMPTIPDSVEHMIRFCKANLIRSCPPPPPSPKNQTLIDLMSLDERKQLQQAKFECQFGHQSITYSLTKKAVYYNPACAICNHEKRIFCEPKSARTSGPVKPISHIKATDKPAGNATVPLFAPPSETEMIESATTPASTASGEAATTDELTSAARANSQSDDSSSSGSFSVLLDLYDPPPEGRPAEQQASANLTASSESDTTGTNQSVLQHQQPQQLPQQQQQQQQLQQPQHPQCSEYQVYDPFHLTCRCMICGLNRKYVKGKCVDRSKPPLVYITDVCLVVSITSLALYLILYMLSTFDLRPLAGQLIRWELEAEAAKQVELEAARESGGGGGESKSATASKQLTFAAGRRNSGGSNEGSNASGPASLSTANRQSQSLSTRGVASLAGSLLGAYLLFMFGHQTETGMQAKRQPICAGLAAATYYFFLVAFFWMFLLSYDIWRTLRLATCQLRAPALHSQSSRFLFYALSAIVVSACLVAFAVLIDLLPPPTGPSACDLPALPVLDPLLSLQPAQRNASCATNGGGGGLWTQFVQTYKPNFGHQPGSCWFTNRRSLALFFGLPVALVMLSNLLFFLHSSCMVIRTSSRSSRQFKSSSPETIKPKFMSLEKGLSNNSMITDFTHQNSLTTSSIISVQTLQSHLSSASNSERNEDSTQQPPPDGDASAPTPPSKAPTNSLPALVMPLHPPAPPTPTPKHHAKLDTSLSSNSLATNHSSCSSSHSIASSIAQKCDSHLQSIQSMMGSIGKDYRLYCRLCTIMGLTWVTGLLASLVGKSEFLWYLFVILNTLQGLFIFIAFGCNRSKLYNLKILLNYLKFWLLYRCCLFQLCCPKQSSPAKKAPTSNGGEPTAAAAGEEPPVRKDSVSSGTSSTAGNT